VTLIRVFFVYALTALFFVRKFSFAQDGIKFSFEDKLFIPNEEIAVSFLFSEDFVGMTKVRPQTNLGESAIFNKQTGAWVLSNQSWENMPYIAEKLRVRLPETDNEQIKLSFVLQNKKLGTVFSSEAVEITTSSELSNYFEKVNRNILTGVSSVVDASEKNSVQEATASVTVKYSNKYIPLLRPAFCLFVSAVCTVLMIKYSGEKVDFGNNSNGNNISGLGDPG